MPDWSVVCSLRNIRHWIWFLLDLLCVVLIYSNERMLIPTVDKFWRHLLDVLVNIPTK